VERAARRPDGVWEVATEHGETRLYDALLVANGHHWDPRWPEPAFPGSESFEGVQMHAHEYVDSTGLEGKNVVVLGMGNSAMDIAVEASQVASNVYLAARRGVHVIPKYLWGRPLDQMGLSPRIPWPVRRVILSAIIRSTTGDLERYGLPKPDHPIGSAHPTISDQILSKLTHGDITPKPNIASLSGSSVRFTDGTEVEADVVVYCTGYKVTFPFFDPDFISAPRNDLPLYRRVFHPEIPNVFFVALLQPLGATMPLAEAQGEWIGSYLRGDYALPPDREMRRDMERERRKMFKRYVASPRHTMQVDFDDYLLELSRERARGAERARARGFELPVAPRVAAALAAA
jgi:cation diffusion facilitator CzcD-associated flavoprotein CzcO